MHWSVAQAAARAAQLKAEQEAAEAKEAEEGAEAAKAAKSAQDCAEWSHSGCLLKRSRPGLLGGCTWHARRCRLFWLRQRPDAEAEAAFQPFQAADQEQASPAICVQCTSCVASIADR